MNDPNRTVIFMTSSGGSPASVVHLPDGGPAVRPLLTVGPNKSTSNGVTTTDGKVTNLFLVPQKYRHQLEASGLVFDAYVIPQGTSTEDIPSNPINGTHFYDQNDGVLFVYSSSDSQWLSAVGASAYTWDIWRASQAGTA